MPANDNHAKPQSRAAHQAALTADIPSDRSANLAPVCSASANGRAAVRYALQAQVTFLWTGEDGSARDGRGHTRDISQKGAYVEAASYPPHGTSVRMNITLPPVGGHGRGLRMEARGRVVRVEPQREAFGVSRFGFAVSNDQVSLCAR